MVPDFRGLIGEAGNTGIRLEFSNCLADLTQRTLGSLGIDVQIPDLFPERYAELGMDRFNLFDGIAPQLEDLAVD